MTPSQAVETVDRDVREALTKMIHYLHLETDTIAEQWDGLARVGGQRDDHAARLLMALEPHLRDIASFATRCREQLIAMNDNPFDR